MSWVDELRRREDVFRRAPSAHNTQPWVLRYDDDTVDIHWDEDRWLTAGDPARRDLFLSVGALIETCLVVASDAGFAVRAEIVVDKAERHAARIAPADLPYPTPFTADTVQRRRCARGRYAPGQITRETLDQIGSYGADLRPLPCRDLLTLLSRADRWLLRTPSVARELGTWLRLTPRHPRYHLDGLTDRALELRRYEAIGLAAALAPSIYPVVRRFGVPSLVAAASRDLLRYDGSVLVLVGPATWPGDLLEHGRALMRVWLALTELDLFVHPLSQILDCAHTMSELRTLLSLAADEFPLAIFRVGRPISEPVRSARIPAIGA